MSATGDVTVNNTVTTDGGSVSIDADSDGNGSGTFSLAAFNPPRKLTSSDGEAEDQFGYSVSVSGDTAIVGAWGDDDHGVQSGSAYIFTRNGGTWTEQAKLTASDMAQGDHFGTSVAISGDTIIAGADWNDSQGQRSGAAYIFTLNGGEWIEQKLTASDAAVDDYFGSTVSISGDTAVV